MADESKASKPKPPQGGKAPQGGKPALEPAQGGTECGGDRDFEQGVVRMAGPLQGDDVAVGDVVRVAGDLVDVVGDRRGHPVPGAARRIALPTEPRRPR